MAFMKDKILITLFSLVLLLSFGSVEQSLACSCASDLCQNYERAEVVFVGKVTEIKKIAEHAYTVGFEISEAYKGIQTEKQINVLSVQNAGGSCGYDFDLNEIYLVFTKNGKDQRGIEGFWTGQCSGIRHIGYAATSLDFLQKSKLFTTRPVILGNVLDVSVGKNRILPIEGIRIKVQSTKNKLRIFHGTTNQFGNFEINVPPGTYQVSPELPKDFIFSETAPLKKTSITVRRNNFNAKCFLIKNIAN